MQVWALRKSTAAAGIFISICGFSSACLAQYRGTAEEQQACTPDALRLCSDFVPDAARITACLRAHYAELGSACHAVFAPDFETPADSRDSASPARSDRKAPRPPQR